MYFRPKIIINTPHIREIILPFMGDDISFPLFLCPKHLQNSKKVRTLAHTHTYTIRNNMILVCEFKKCREMQYELTNWLYNLMHPSK